jgi:uncharacterized protein
MKNYLAKDVDDYIAHAPKEAQAKLEEIRAAITSAVPEAEEYIKWWIPFYMYQGLLAGFSAFKNHITFGLCFTFTQEDRNILEAKGYKTGKKTVQITFAQKAPAELKQMLKHQAQANKDKKASKTTMVTPQAKRIMKKQDKSQTI